MLNPFFGVTVTAFSATLLHLDLAWCVRRLPGEVIAVLKKYPGRVFVTGGFIRACIAREAINDIDLIVDNPELAAAITLDLQGKRPAIRTANAYTLTRFKPAVQIIHRWTYADPASCLREFDFTIACAAIWWDGKSWLSLTHDRFYADLAAKRIVYLAPVRHEDAGGSFLRLLKFTQRGYRAPLDSQGAIIARLVRDVRQSALAEDGEEGLARVITGLLCEIDPLLDPDHIAHMPSEKGLITDDDDSEEVQ